MLITELECLMNINDINSWQVFVIVMMPRIRGQWYGRSIVSLSTDIVTAGHNN